jgi:precorrin-3B synthase
MNAAPQDQALSHAPVRAQHSDGAIRMTVRGACPGIASPMQTGDGLLARLIPRGPVRIEAFVALCRASEQYGNGIIEVTQRGNLQIRGLSDRSAPEFARLVSSLQIAQDGGPPILTSPLFGLEATDASILSAVAALRAGVSDRPELSDLNPKVSVLVDTGGRLHLDALSADVRLRLTDAAFELALAGDARSSVPVGWVRPGDVVSTVLETLRRIASLGPHARATELKHLPVAAHERPAPRAAAEPIAIHSLASGQVALGVALAFGHATSSTLQRFADAAATRGAVWIRPAPGRALLIIGLTPRAAGELSVAADALGFVTDPVDSRRFVVACAGAPACSSAKLPTRQLAAGVALAVQGLAGPSRLVHLSGCSKGCAHAGAATVTVVGPDRLILNGCPTDSPHKQIPPGTVVQEIKQALERVGAEPARA